MEHSLTNLLKGKVINKFMEYEKHIAHDVRDILPVATLGSIVILAASFLQKLDFILKTDGLWQPFLWLLSSGLLLLLSSASYLSYRIFKKAFLYDFLFELTLFFGIILFFAGSILTFIAFIRFGL